jgi:hypothetical protein
VPEVPVSTAIVASGGIIGEAAGFSMCTPVSGEDMATSADSTPTSSPERATAYRAGDDLSSTVLVPNNSLYRDLGTGAQRRIRGSLNTGESTMDSVVG